LKESISSQSQPFGFLSFPLRFGYRQPIVLNPIQMNEVWFYRLKIYSYFFYISKNSQSKVIVSQLS